MTFKTLLGYNCAVAMVSIGFMTVSLPTPAQNTINIISILKNGGNVIYLRHEKVEKGERPVAVAIAQIPSRYAKCDEPGRTLGNAGVATMKKIGERFKALEIPVGRVLSSPSCRAIETAWYGFGKAEVEPALDGTPREKIWVELHPLLTTQPTEGKNTILSTHSTNIKALAGIVLEEGEAVIFTPDGKGGFTQVGRIKKDEW